MIARESLRKFVGKKRRNEQPPQMQRESHFWYSFSFRRLQGGSEFAEGHLPSHVSSLPEVKTDSFFFCIYPWEKIKLEIDGKPLMSGLRG